MTKHEQILHHIESLKVGTHISVRRIAKDMEVSEGTAYRAIKEAESQGLVSTKERIGTVRVEKKQRSIDKLTFAEVVNMVDGEVLGGAAGLNKPLHKFVIGAMEEEAMLRYIDAGSLLIIGNREKGIVRALENGAAVLITGGFDTGEEAKKMADDRELPIISSTYDTFTVASMINRAIYDRMIKKKIMLVEDILSPDNRVWSLKSSGTVDDWRKLVQESGHNRFPVLDEWNRVIGMLTPKDMINASDWQPIDKLMTRNPVTAHLRTSVSSAAHQMVWEGIELLPITDSNRKLIGVISRNDVLKVMQYIQRQPQVGETFDDLMWNGFGEEKDDQGTVLYRGTVSPQMTNHLGIVSAGVLSTLMTQAAYRVVKDYKKGDLVIDNISTYFLHPVQMESEILIKPRIIDSSRVQGKIDVEIHTGGRMAAKAMLTVYVFDQN